MKLGIFTTITNPKKRGDAWKPAFECYKELADELVVVDGTEGFNHGFLHDDYKVIPSQWNKEFSWDFIGQQFQLGYVASDSDWIIHADVDFIFHEKDLARIRQALKEAQNAPAVSFYKWQFILPDRYNLKSRLILAVNKKQFGDRITFSGSGDLCQPQLDGVDLDINEMPQAGIPFYNYEKLLKTKEQIMDDVGRMDRAYQRYFGKWLYSEDGTDKSAFEGWLRMVHGRFNKPSKHIRLEEHPKYIQDTIKNLTPEQFGYSMFGYEENDYVRD